MEGSINKDVNWGLDSIRIECSYLGLAHLQCSTTRYHRTSIIIDINADTWLDY